MPSTSATFRSKRDGGTDDGRVELLISRLPLERWQEFRDLRLRALETDPAAFGQTRAVARTQPDEFWQSRLCDVHDGAAWIVFAELDRRLVAMVGAFQTDHDRERRTATICGAFVDPAARGRGIARTMLNELLKQLQEVGMLAATLAVNKEQTTTST